MATLRRRTRLFILRSFQIRYITLILVFMLATALMTGFTVYYTTWVMFGEKLAAVYPQGLLLDIVQKVNTVLLLRLLFVTPLVVLIALVLSHRIAGPIYRIQRFVKKLNAGDYAEKLKLRERDELQDVAVSLNGLAGRLGSEKEKRSRRIDDIVQRLDEIEEELLSGQGGSKSFASKIKAVSDDLKKLRSK